MFYVQDEDLGRIDICELVQFDMLYIVKLLLVESQRTANQNIKDRVGRLIADLKPAIDYELAWADVFLISSLLLNESVKSNEKNRQAERLLIAFEAAAKNIIVSAE